MPELPEVEVTRLSFQQEITGATVQAVRMGKPLRWPLGLPPNELVGRQVLGVRRRGKYLLMDLSQGMLLLHLGMSGSLRFSRHLAEPAAHDHFDLVTTQGTLRLHDPRRFGAVVYADDADAPIAHKLLGHLGVEPFSDQFTLEHFYKGLRATKVPVKTALLQGSIVVGVGNIYASESLFRARIAPTAASQRLSRVRVERLRLAVIEVLSQALAQGGSTLKDFSSAQGQSGYFQLSAQVYDRKGEPCRACMTPIRMIRQGQRATYFCPACQKT